MTGRPAGGRDHWVVCDDYASGPYTAEAAEAKRAKFAHDGLCSLPHTIVQQAAKPDRPAWSSLEED